MEWTALPVTSSGGALARARHSWRQYSSSTRRTRSDGMARRCGWRRPGGWGIEPRTCSTRGRREGWRVHRRKHMRANDAGRPPGGRGLVRASWKHCFSVYARTGCRLDLGDKGFQGQSVAGDQRTRGVAALYGLARPFVLPSAPRIPPAQTCSRRLRRAAVGLSLFRGDRTAKCAGPLRADWRSSTRSGSIDHRRVVSFNRDDCLCLCALRIQTASARWDRLFFAGMNLVGNHCRDPSPGSLHTLPGGVHRVAECFGGYGGRRRLRSRRHCFTHALFWFVDEHDAPAAGPSRVAFWFDVTIGRLARDDDGLALPQRTARSRPCGLDGPAAICSPA